MKKIAILGSTGSIGTQALEIVQAHPDEFQAEVLTAGNNAGLLIKQAIQFKPNTVVIQNKEKFAEVRDALENYNIKVFAGEESIEQIVEMDEIDMVLVALVGYAGLKPTINAIKHQKTIALANKETLVVAGHLVTKLAEENAVNIYPVDSEHSAVFQCLNGEFHNPVEKIILTASGGPFYTFSLEEMKTVTKQQALQHPTWNMGAKITIDSATMMNKALEIIEAKWLFGLHPEQIEVVVHPQSIVHSMVQFLDGSMMAQLGLPDMKTPILYAFSYPNRLQTKHRRLSFKDVQKLEFVPPDLKKFRNLAVAFQILEKEGNSGCVVNAANEMAVDAFLQDKISFLAISDIVEECFASYPYMKEPSLEDLMQTNEEVRIFTNELMQKKSWIYL